MSLTLSVKVKPKDLAKILKQEKADIARGIDKAIGLTAAKGKDIILSRTKKGVGVNGGFKGYSTAYAKFRKDVLGKEKPNTVNLNATGEMVRNVQSRNKDSRTAEVYFSNRNAAEKAAWTDRTRPWFSFNDGEENRLSKVFQRELFR
jgi:hypothetical protein